MGRIRTIKPEFPQSESMGRLTREARLCFILLWTIVDDSGRTRASSKLLAGLLYPYDDDAAKRIPSWLDELRDEQCVNLYEVEGTTYLEIVKFNIHQKIDKPSQPKWPAFSEGSESIRGVVDEPSVTYGKGREGKGSRKVATAPEKPTLPEWLPEDLWVSFVDSRRAAKKPFTTLHAQDLAIKSLIKYREAGYDTTAIIEKSVERGWMGFVVNEETPKLKKVYRIMTPEESRASLLEGMTQ